LYNVTYRTSSGETQANSRFYDTLYRAYKNDPEQYKILFRKLEQEGVSGSKITAAMESRQKKDLGISDVDNLPERILTPEEGLIQERAQNKVHSSPLYKNATPEQKEEADTLINSLVREDRGEAEKALNVLDAAEENDIAFTRSDWVLYKLALDMVDQPNDKGNLGSFTNAEREEAIRLLTINDSAKDFLWSEVASGKGKDNPPNW
jgi:hypothetical protein